MAIYLSEELHADPTLVNKYKKTPLHQVPPLCVLSDQSLCVGHLSTISGLISFFLFLFGLFACLIFVLSLPTPLQASEKGHVDVVRYLVDKHKLSPNAKNSRGDTPLSFACRAGSLPIVEHFLSSEVHEADFSSCNHVGRTPFHHAVEEKRYEVVRYVLEREIVDVNAGDLQGWTPLFIAADAGDSALVTLLLKYGANPDVPTQKGNTALAQASRHGSLGIVRYLVEVAGADPSPVNANGKNAAQQALESQHTAVYKYLREL
jgi:ankyrin repeat protein